MNEEKEKYYYLVSYIRKERGCSSFYIGRVLIARKKEIETLKEIEEIEKEIEEQSSIQCKIIVISWEKLKKYEND